MSLDTRCPAPSDEDNHLDNGGLYKFDLIRCQHRSRSIKCSKGRCLNPDHTWFCMFLQGNEEGGFVFFHRWLDTSSSHTQLCHCLTSTCLLGAWARFASEEGRRWRCACFLIISDRDHCNVRQDFPCRRNTYLKDNEKNEIIYSITSDSMHHTHIHSIPASTIGAWPVNTNEYDMYTVYAMPVGFLETAAPYAIEMKLKRLPRIRRGEPMHLWPLNPSSSDEKDL